ncbi:molybdate ABC transporter substrate-binding protein [Paracrocinitomix mangrovi]|uniref:molybdate ABC transporter substrate-binding protein n=1 Tax=Paracrocinitomix mangrovi TaxID=2862509 RepID=UPI001C8DA284|nr:molybdate ABC transporter substrate-binding protein [Paracrocinitomix mangrovi]UKN00583.1 molybdate ABC transporter substrate-binding protein [Paracrocinitomix mangrovi]
MVKQLSFLISIVFLSSCGGDESKEDQLNIACAANMEVAIDSICKVFEQEQNIKCQVNSGASGMLYTQINQGAPFDVFVAADDTYPMMLFNDNLCEKPEVYAKGQLVLVIKNVGRIRSVEEVLLSDEVQKIGIPDSSVAPYGKAAMEALASLKLDELINDKIVWAESVGQVNQFYETHAVDAIFTSYSFVKTPGNNFNHLLIADSLYQPIQQSACVIKKENTQNESAQAFQSFILSEKSQNILLHFGYKMN